MQLLTPLLFGISASLDGLLVGIGFGLRRIRIRIWQNMIISLITLLGTCLSTLLGSSILPLLPGSLSAYIGSSILALFGIYYIIKWLCKRNHCELTESSKQQLPGLSTRETLFLSITLSVNNWGIGLSASMAGLGMIPAAIATLCCSVLFLFIGNRMGQSKLLRFIGKGADPISGLLLIGLGLLQLVL